MTAVPGTSVIAENVSGGDVVVFAEGQEMVERQLVRAALVAGVHGLAGVEDVRDLLLGFVRVFAEIPVLLTP